MIDIALEVFCFLLGCAFEALVQYVVGVWRDTTAGVHQADRSAQICANRPADNREPSAGSPGGGS